MMLPHVIRFNSREPEISRLYQELFDGDLAADTYSELNNKSTFTSPITQREVREAIKSMKNGKAPGEDEIPIELIKYGGEKLIFQLTNLFNL